MLIYFQQAKHENHFQIQDDEFMDYHNLMDNLNLLAKVEKTICKRYKAMANNILSPRSFGQT